MLWRRTTIAAVLLAIASGGAGAAERVRTLAQGMLRIGTYFVNQGLEGERDALLAAEHAVTPAPAAMLLDLKGIGPDFATILWSEGLFRHFDNRRQIASYAGLAPTPWKSGSIDREQGVSKAGNPRLRTTLIQLAWLWIRHQPHSALTVWFEERVKRNGGRLKKTTIVALARKLLVALWKYVTAGVIIEGAVLKAA